MSRIVKKNIETVRLLSKLRLKKDRKKLLDTHNSDLVRALCEIIQNVLNGNVKLSPSEIKRLKKYHRDILKIAHKTTSLKKKKQLIIQKGGFLATLIPPAIALLTALLT